MDSQIMATVSVTVLEPPRLLKFLVGSLRRVSLSFGERPNVTVSAIELRPGCLSGSRVLVYTQHRYDDLLRSHFLRLIRAVTIALVVIGPV